MTGTYASVCVQNRRIISFYRSFITNNDRTYIYIEDQKAKLC